MTTYHSDAEILIIGEAPSKEDVRTKSVFSGFAGRDLDNLLTTVGISRDQCNLVNLMKRQAPRGDCEAFFVNARKLIPSKELLIASEDIKRLINQLRPKVILCLGGLPLWALTGNYSIAKWRGSQLQYTFSDGTSCWITATYHPRVLHARWALRGIIVQDLRRLKNYENWKQPEYSFLIRPTCQSVMEFLDEIESQADGAHILVSGDIETRGGYIACFGIAVSRTRAITIPFMDIKRNDGSYWTADEEVAIVLRIVRLFRNPRIHWAFQNGLYDFQYFARFWGTVPFLATDTMLEHHVAWSGDLPKGLDFLSSMYSTFHVYWKEDGKLWDPRYTPEDELWIYNSRDCTVTWEVAEVLSKQSAVLGIEKQVNFQCLRQFPAVLAMMLRGVRCDTSNKAQLSTELRDAYAMLEARLHHICDEPLNVRSPKQMATFFYETLNLKVVRNRSTYRPSTDAKSLSELCKKHPWITPLVDIISLMRSVGVFKSTFVDMTLDNDQRIRCSYNIAGTETFRYASSKNAFNTGTNLQNIPDGKKTQSEYLPNVRKIFVPDPGYIFAEFDLAQADAQVVAWEANDDKLKYIFRNGIDLHLANASDIYNLGIQLEDIRDPEGIEFYKKKYPRERQAAKGGVHAVNYGAASFTLGRALGISQRDAQVFIDKWFSEHPGIQNWQARINVQLQSTREVRNAFGFRRYYFDRVDNLLPEALAWIPQSTVALVIDNGLVNLHENLKEVQPLLQVHDSLAAQFLYKDMTELLPKIHKQLTIPIPYSDPLTIPVGIAVSRKSWGDKREITWDFAEEVNW